ncbi:TonB-dependent receptor [Parabacteroides acidifaciens]|uniref:SusC/RagA family TonB-linked outer membrane protein n=2 Tax=Parabacteroides acidifaciens TaxID=2290935 RepID=A0A3D8HD44_9BACT|nr:TonB-dependent receptor [Parabacteroides acidifaciens]RDU48903.1 SusC/RagA family TonB-linked outer membrane protein [Parabacteroides acidifaciens]
MSFTTYKVAIICLLLCVACPLFASHDLLQDPRITLHLKNVSLKQVFNEIENQSGYSFLLRNNDVDVEQNVSINVENRSIKDILDILFENKDVTYDVKERRISVYRSTDSSLQSKKIRRISGIVKDSHNEPVAGASVSVLQTTNGTVTDMDGNFTLDIPEGSTLQVSFIGYRPQNVVVGNRTILDITLQEDTQALDEIVVVGFGTQKKVNLTGSVGVATSKDFESRPVQNAVLALQGVVPGLNITNSGNGGELNAAKSIDIRGTGTIGNTSSSPLILIDGMAGDLKALNPQDIESVSVLKDAAASSIYGSRAPFGVILITTKTGKTGRAQVNYNVNVRFNTPVMLPELQNSYQFVNYFNEAQFNTNQSILFDAAYVQLVKDYMDGKLDPNNVVGDYGTGGGGKWNYDYTYANVNWLEEYYRSMAPSQEHNVSVSGGTEKINYYLSGNYMSQDGFMRYGTDTEDRFTLTAKISGQLTKHFKLDYNSRFIRDDYARPSVMNTDFYDNLLRRARPTRAIKDPNGYYMTDINYIQALEDGGRYKEQKDDLYNQMKVTFTPLKDWNIIAEMNVRTSGQWQHTDYKRVYAHYQNDPSEIYVANGTSPNLDSVREYSYKSTYLNPNVYSNYSFSLDKNNFAVMIGFQAEREKLRSLTGYRSGMISTDMPILDLTTDIDNTTVGGNYNNWATAGFFGRLNYDYNGRYMAEVNLRYDGSSRFRADQRWIWTPSFSLGWNIARENFWENWVDVIQTLKFRGSYGELANQNTSSYYPTYQTITTGTSNGTWLINGAKPNTATVPSLISSTLTWEKVRTTNIGLDWGALNNRFTGSLDYFVRKTLNMVGPGVELPVTLGTSVPNTNNCDLKTYGWELELAWRDHVGDFSYGVKMNISDSQTKILRYANPTGSMSGSYIEGELINNIYGYTTLGIAKTDEEMEAHLASLPNGGQSAIGSSWAAGDVMYADINGDGKISNGDNTIYDMGDKKKIGNSTPRFRTGITFDASYKGFDFQMFWQGVLKRDYDPGEDNMVFWGANTGNWQSTFFTDHLDYFRSEDDTSIFGVNIDGYYPRPLFNTKNKKTQTRFVQNAAYMRLKNLQLGYTFPKVVLNTLRLQNLRIYVSGENLLTITKLSNTMDPETAGIGRKGGTVYPLSRTYSLGLSVNF